MAGSDAVEPRFARVFFGSPHPATVIGGGEIGGKAKGLFFARDLIAAHRERLTFPGLEIGIPTMTVVGTEIFERFLAQGGLPGDVEGRSDEWIAHAFQRADLPVEIVGDLNALVEQVRQPLAIRSSSRLEDALGRPFAGVYATKMIPNNQPDPSARFRVLVEALKYVWASTFFADARAYRAATGGGEEKMAVVIQEVVGRRHFERFYPDVSGVARSWNFYPMGSSLREDGVVDLALGLGKTIVDGGLSWSYAPGRPEAPPPFASAADRVRKTQRELWAVNMGPPPAYDPLQESEYLTLADLEHAELDGTLRWVASTWLPASDRLVPGVEAAGARCVDFAPILVYGARPLDDAVRALLALCEEAVGNPVEIEFALAFEESVDAPAQLAFLQVRPLVVSRERVQLAPEDLGREDVLVASDHVLGNGILTDVRDIVYVRPGGYDTAQNVEIAREAEGLNRAAAAEGRRYLLVGFGRWGSSEPWLGSPVTWAQIHGAAAIVEVSLPDLPGELSQGSHFFHNVTSFSVPYFSVRHDAGGRIDWDWLERQPAVRETAHLRHVALETPLEIRVDGVTGRGVVRRP
ncbi:MAG: PEP/pyruvate-binding domain-containing protein [bacterium]